MSRFASIATALATIFAVASAAQATDLMCESRDASYMSEHSDLVFLSRLVEIVEDPDDADLPIARLAVLKRWKGPDLRRTVDVVWSGDPGLFLPDVSYLIYAKRTNGDRWHVASNACGNRVLLPHPAESHLAALGVPEWDFQKSRAPK